MSVSLGPSDMVLAAPPSGLSSDDPVIHLVGDGGKPACGDEGNFRRLELQQFPESAPICRGCRRARESEARPDGGAAVAATMDEPTGITVVIPGHVEVSDNGQVQLSGPAAIGSAVGLAAVGLLLGSRL